MLCVYVLRRRVGGWLGRYLATGGYDSMGSLWDLSDMMCIQNFAQSEYDPRAPVGSLVGVLLLLLSLLLLIYIFFIICMCLPSSKRDV